MYKKLKITREALKPLSKALLGIMTFAILSTPIQAFAHDSYFVAITVDTGSYNYMSTVAFDDNSSKANNHKEAQLGAGFFNPTVLNGTFVVPKITTDPTLEGKDIKSYDGTLLPPDGDKGLIYTFPSVHTGAIFSGAYNDATTVDMDRAYWVSTTAVSSFNDALKLIMGNSTLSGDKTKVFMQLGANLANAGGVARAGGTGTFEYGNKIKYSVTKAVSPKVAPGLLAENYVTVSGANIATTTFIYDVPKGYYYFKDAVHQSVQPLYSTVPEKIKKNYIDKDIAYLSWKHIALQGNYNYEMTGVSYSGVDAIVKPGKITQAINEFFNDVLGSLRSALGLYSLQELMLSQGTRGTTFYAGIMPVSWYKSAQILHWVSQVIAWMLIMGALVKLLVQRNIASINTAMRVNLMEGIQNIILTGFLLTLIIPLFQIICILNSKLVAVFGSASAYVEFFGNAKGTSAGLIGGIIINCIYFYVTLYFNFVYIVRAITVSLLYGVAPLFVCSIAFGGKYKQMFGTFVKELISNIYMQTFHAILLAFIANLSAMGSARGIESVVIVYAFIPLTQFFRTNLMGLSGDATEKIAGNALSGGLGVAGSFASGAVSKAKSTSKSNSENKSKSKSNSNTTSDSNIKTKSFDDAKFKKGTGNSSSSGTGTSGENGTSIESGTIHGLGNDAKDIIPNNELKSVPNAISKVANSGAVKGAVMGAKAIGSVGKVALQIAKVPVGAGIALGNSAIGNKDGVRSGTDMMKSGIGDVRSMGASVGSSVKSGINNKSQKQGNEGHMYHEDLGNGSIDYKMNEKGLKKDTGISDMTDTGNGVQYALDGKYDADTNKFTFANDELNSGEDYENLNEMIGAYASDDDDAKAYYKTQGIKGIGVNDNNQLVVSSAKGRSGMNSVSKSGKSFIINKSNDAPVSMKSGYNVPSYTQYSEKSKQGERESKQSYKKEKVN